MVWYRLVENFEVKKSSKIVLCGAQECPYSSHMGIPDNIKVRERMYNEGMADKNTKFILTHFAHSFAPFYESMMEIAEKYGFIAAYDGFAIDI